ncbi:MAG: DUF3127 domain-containing protein [Muribaculaceae bacterium]|nr:DUF3127 domain-containing protein [Muribaculaceae bacterium]
MDFKGRVIQKFDLESGTSKAGNAWSKQSWLLETEGQYPRKVKVDAMGRSVENVHMEVGRYYNVSVDAESREYNGRWYTDLKVYRAVEETGASEAFGGQPGVGSQAAPASPFGGATTAPSAPAGFPPAPEAPAFTDSPDDLPF